MNNNFLIDDFFYLVGTEIISQGNIRFNVRLNKEHNIYKGHFPNIPIVPGVCMIQMIKELLSKYMEKNLFLTKVENVKFINVINPQIVNTISMDIEYQKDDNENILCKAKLFYEEKIYMRLSGTFHIIVEQAKLLDSTEYLLLL
jgi:3-hydroxyacyl-[acyl-carrier-protein] dehydratase